MVYLMNFIGNGEQATYIMYLFSVRLTRVEEKLNKVKKLARLAPQVITPAL